MTDQMTEKNMTVEKELPLVSVIIPNYNGARFLAATLDAILAQSYPNKEILVVDDGSTDASLQVLEAYSAEHPQVRVFAQRNLNASIARNRGLEHAKGKYLYFLDADDVIHDGALELLVRTAEKTGADLTLGNVDEINEAGELLKENRWFSTGVSENWTDFVDVEIPAPPNKLFRAATVLDNGVVFGNVRIGQDLNFLLKFLPNCKSIATLEEPIYSWRKVSTSMSHVKNFRIFDITESFADVRKYYVSHGLEADYESWLRMVEYHNYYRQMEKQKNFDNAEDRRLIVQYFKRFLRQLPLDQAKNYDRFAHDVKACRTKLLMGPFYPSALYRKIKH